MTLIPIAKAGSSSVDAERVQIVDGSGVQITSFGGGTQYADGAAAATPTGTQVNWNESGTQRAVSLTKALPVQPGTGATFPISAAALPLPSTAATSTKQSDGSQKTQIVDGSGNVISSTSNALNVNITGGSSAGTEYTDGDAAPANPEGGTITFDDAGTMRAVSDTNPLPVLASIDTTGLATSANQTTIIGHLDGVEGLLGTIDADTGNISTKIDTLAGAVSGTELQVDVVAALPAGTNAIGKLAANSGVDIGDVDVTSINGFAAHDAGIAGNPLIIGGVSSAAAPTSVSADQEAVRAWYLRNGAAATVLTAAGALIGGDATNGLDVDVTRLPALAAGTNNIGDVDVLTVNGVAPAFGSGARGATVQRVTIATDDVVPASQSGTWNVGTVTTVTTVSALGAGTTGPMKAEDVASAAGDQGIAIMAARLDTPVANAGVSNDGDYTTPILDNFRKLWVTGTEKEDTAHVAGEAIVLNGVRRIDTAATSAGTSGDWATMDASAEGAVWSTLTPTTTSGCSIFRSIDLDESEEEVKATAGNVYGYYVFNAAASVAYLKFYNATAANVTVGTTTPVMTFPVPAGSAANVSFAYPISFSTAICAAVTTGLADNDTGAPAANAFIANIFYK